MNPKRDLFFKEEFVKAFETCNEQLTQYYLVLKTSSFIALGIIQKVVIHLDKATENVSITNSVAKNLRCFIHGRSVKINICGNLFLSGSYGVCASDNLYLEEAIKIVADYLKKEKEASLNFLKDLGNKLPTQNKIKTALGYHHFAVEPNMALYISSDWQQFDDYKKSLKSKYRVKINRAETLSERLSIQPFSSEEIIKHKDELQQLLENITDKALWKTIDLNIETYSTLKESFGCELLFNVYYLEGRMVGFATGFHNRDELVAHFVGIDYKFNKDHSIYPRILNDYVKETIHRKCTKLNLGRTSGEIKSTLGAAPVNLYCYVRHKRSMANLIFKPLTDQIDLPEYRLHKPFKKVL
ncbi:MAG: GNAT family N-acetyltransferase [Nonlabens sp.]